MANIQAIYRYPVKGLTPEPLARAAVATGVNGIFVEVHDRPEEALSDGPNALRLNLLAVFWRRLQAIHSLVSAWQ